MNQPPIDLHGKKALVVRLSALGDVIRTLPYVLALIARFPDARFSWLVEDASAALLRGVPGLDLIEIDRKATRARNPLAAWAAVRRVVQRVRAERFDCAIDFHGVLKSGLYPLLAGVPVRIGYDRGGSKEGHRWLINRRLALPDAHISRYDRNHALAAWLAPGLQPQTPPLAIDAAARDKVDQLVADRPILLFPGVSAWGRHKQWHPRHWAWLFEQAAGLYPTRFVFGPADDACREALTERLGAPPPALPPLSMIELGRALQRARMLVAGDTGPMHLASVLNVPLVVLFGPADPVISRPLSRHWRGLAPGVPCAPCRNRGCQTLVCHTNTTPHRVLDAIRELDAELERAAS